MVYCTCIFVLGDTCGSTLQYLYQDITKLPTTPRPQWQSYTAIAHSLKQLCLNGPKLPPTTQSPGEGASAGAVCRERHSGMRAARFLATSWIRIKNLRGRALGHFIFSLIGLKRILFRVRGMGVLGISGLGGFGVKGLGFFLDFELKFLVVGFRTQRVPHTLPLWN